IHARLTTAVRGVVDDPETADRIRQMGLDPLSSTPEELRARVLRDRTFYAPIVQASGVQQD
ncbi:MAG: tripartite tricarboxylate transporter substrate binding protein, partial [Rhodospirillales bacterium]|nr:tripartite tricarboxylate transporter substrate binding protein [Rhodospirillales bacterium]